MTRAQAADLLGVSDDVDPEAVDAAFRRAISRHHPDLGGRPHVARRLIEARAVMLNQRAPQCGAPRRNRTFVKQRRFRWR